MYKFLLLFLINLLVIESHGNSLLGDSVGKGTIITLRKPYLNRPYQKRNFLKDDGDTSTYKRWSNIVFSGYARMFFQYRTLQERYDTTLNRKSFFINGYDIMDRQAVGYQEPLFFIQAEGRPTLRTYFKVQYAFDHQMTGMIKDTSTTPIVGVNTPYTRRASLYRNLNFEGNAYTDIGTFRIVAGGGVIWHRLSPFTLWSYEFTQDLFERTPWEGTGGDLKRYYGSFNEVNIPRYAQWGFSGVQGFIFEGKDLPGRLGFSFVYGKGDNGTIFQSYRTRTPKNLFAGRVFKGIGPHKVGVNFFNQFGADSTTAFFQVKQNIVTTDLSLSLPFMRIYFEGGVGRYRDSVISREDYKLLYKRDPGQNEVIVGEDFPWQPCLNLQLDFLKEFTRIPFSVQLFYVGKSVVNVNSAVINSANPRAVASVQYYNTPNDVTTFQGFIPEVGQLTNNRWGINLKHEDTYGKLKFYLATGVNREIENLFDTITFLHRANQFVRSRFNFFESSTGPYGRIVSFYRTTLEKVAIVDFGYPKENYKKTYNTLDIGLKYKIRLFNKDLVLSNYNNYSSVQDRFSPAPLFSDKAFLRFFYQEFMSFYAIHPKITLVGFASRETVNGNRWTELADENGNVILGPDNKPAPSLTGKPIAQRGYGFGIGLDYTINERTGLYIRHRWFGHKDINFIKDRFKGEETSLELKYFF